jgi:2-keto-myo-inositol isomerase
MPPDEETAMTAFALNHMTVARLSFADLLDLAAGLGLVGVELRNDLSQPLFDGRDPAEAGARMRARGLRLLALAEVKRFDDWSADRRTQALALMRIARAAGAESVALIPRNDAPGLAGSESRAALRRALRDLGPMLEDHGLVGLVEPLGFASCPLRFKGAAVEAIEALDLAGRVRIVHDTFHHHLAAETQVFPDHTGLVHVSGVTAPLPAEAMTDAGRGLVGAGDRLDNLGQLAALAAAGYAGPVSFECFAPEVHALADPAPALARSMAFLDAGTGGTGTGATASAGALRDEE